MKLFSEDGEVNISSRVNSVKSKERHAFKNNTMSTDTKYFIQKICYRKTASIDMTQYGFVNDSKVNPIDYMIKPLREQLEKICVKTPSVKHHKSTPTSSRTMAREIVSPTERKPTTCTPKSAMRYSGTRSSRTRFRKVRIQIDPSPVLAVNRDKKVSLVIPRRSKGKNVGQKKRRSTKKNEFYKMIMLM